MHPEISLIVALLTPFTDHGDVDFAALRDHVELLVDEGVDGVMACGTTGEGSLLTDEETLAVVACVTGAAAGRARVLAHVGRPSTEGTIRLARRAIADGADAVSAVVPYYYELEAAALLAHYRALLAAARNTPVYAYNIPSRTGNDLEPDCVRALAAEGLAGLKDSTKSLERHLEYLESVRGTDCAVLIGSDGMVLEALRAGAAGSVSALANVRPDLLLRLKHAFLKGRAEEAEAAQEEIAQLRAQFSQGRPLSQLKRAVAERLREAGSSYSPFLRAPLLG